MNDRLQNALRALLHLDRALKPVPFADAREAALVEGLHGLAAEYGLRIDFTRIDGNGEMAFNVLGRPGRYGAALAAWLSRVPRRNGLVARTNSRVLPENNWCWINHFDVERLLLLVASEHHDTGVVV